jgi:hypothetical protein
MSTPANDDAYDLGLVPTPPPTPHSDQFWSDLRYLALQVDAGKMTTTKFASMVLYHMRTLDRVVRIGLDREREAMQAYVDRQKHVFQYVQQDHEADYQRLQAELNRAPARDDPRGPQHP